ncbi:MAG: hypothetical protein H0U10_17780 [Chloroflexia bacterium]|nr:hypothetical protein [Chloroflexia bacterium]
MLLLQAVPVSAGTIAAYWWVSLGIGLVVTVVVAILLAILTRTAERIEAGAAEIWRVGKLIANNTVHVPLLVRTNQLAGGILAAAGGIAAATARIERAATGGGPAERG